jgi:hypothetical protein
MTTTSVKRYFAFLVLSAILLSACGTGQPSPQISLTVDTSSAEALTILTGLGSFHSEITITTNGTQDGVDYQDSQHLVYESIASGLEQLHSLEKSKKWGGDQILPDS